MTLESEALLADVVPAARRRTRPAAVAHAVPVGGFTGWRQAMPVTQWTVRKPPDAARRGRCRNARPIPRPYVMRRPHLERRPPPRPYPGRPLERNRMTVYFIGAGPGAADLITVRGARMLASCRVCLYAGSLVPRELLAECPPGARLVDTARLNLDEITAEMVTRPPRPATTWPGCTPATRRCSARSPSRCGGSTRPGVPYEVVPGVPAFAAAAAALKRELTVPTVGQTVILTRIAAARHAPCRRARTSPRSGAAAR